MNCETTYEELSGLARDELDVRRCDELREHLVACETCRRRLAALNRTDEVLKSLPPFTPPAEAILAARRALVPEIRPEPASEIMTLEQTAEFLRITPGQLGEIVEELPAFELAGQIRLRRETLLKWIEQRERDYSRQANQSWAARCQAVSLGKGVA